MERSAIDRARLVEDVTVSVTEPDLFVGLCEDYVSPEHSRRFLPELQSGISLIVDSPVLYNDVPRPRRHWADHHEVSFTQHSIRLLLRLKDLPMAEGYLLMELLTFERSFLYYEGLILFDKTRSPQQLAGRSRMATAELLHRQLKPALSVSS